MLAVLVSSSVCRKSAGGEGGKAGNEVGGRDEGTQTTAPVSRASASASASGGVYQYGLGPSDNASIQEIQKAGHVRCVCSPLARPKVRLAGGGSHVLILCTASASLRHPAGSRHTGVADWKVNCAAVLSCTGIRAAWGRDMGSGSITPSRFWCGPLAGWAVRDNS